MSSLQRGLQEDSVWFALSAPYRSEMKAKTLLEQNNIQCFIPMQYKLVKNRSGRKQKKLLPIISNLVFAKTYKQRLQEVKNGVPYLQYRTITQDNKNIPIIVPEEQMNNFMAVCNTYNEELIYLLPNEVNLKKGTKVKIIGGCFDGVEGIFIKVKGSRKKRVVVLIQGVAAVATTEISEDLIEVLK